MSIPAATLLDQLSAGSSTPQAGGIAPSAPANTGIFESLLGNIQGTPGLTPDTPPIDQTIIQTGGQANAENSELALLNVNLVVPASLSAKPEVASGGAVAPGSVPGTGPETTSTSQVLPLGDALDPAKSARMTDAPNSEASRVAGQQPPANPQNSQPGGRPDIATLDKMTAALATSLQKINTPAGAQAFGTPLVPGLRTTPSPGEASVKITAEARTANTQLVPGQRSSLSPGEPSRSGSQTSESQRPSAGAPAASNAQTISSPNAGLIASLQSSPKPPVGGAGIDRPDGAAAGILIDPLIPVREAAIVQNYSRQMRLAGGEVRAPVNNLAIEISAYARTGARQFEIRMDPPELGRIDVRLDVRENGTVTTRLVVERAETLDLLQRDARFLERALSDNGLKLDDGGVRMSLKGDGAGQHAQPGDRNFDEQREQSGDAVTKNSIDALEDEFDAPPPIHQMIANGGIDIRV